MKRIFLTALFSCLLVVSSATLVLAREGESSSSGLNKKPDIKSNREDVKELMKKREEELKARRQETEEKLKEKRQVLKDKRYEKFLERIQKVLKNRSEHLQRLDNIHDKIQSRIDKLKARGIDVSSAQAALVACSDSKAAAQASIKSAEDGISNIDFNSTTAADQAKAQVKAIEQGNGAVKTYYDCLNGVLKTLKATKGVEDEKAESPKPTIIP